MKVDGKETDSTIIVRTSSTTTAAPAAPAAPVANGDNSYDSAATLMSFVSAWALSL